MSSPSEDQKGEQEALKAKFIVYKENIMKTLAHRRKQKPAFSVPRHFTRAQKYIAMMQLKHKYELIRLFMTEEQWTTYSRASASSQRDILENMKNDVLQYSWMMLAIHILLHPIKTRRAHSI